MMTQSASFGSLATSSHVLKHLSAGSACLVHGGQKPWKSQGRGGEETYGHQRPTVWPPAIYESLSARQQPQSATHTDTQTEPGQSKDNGPLIEVLFTFSSSGFS